MRVWRGARPRRTAFLELATGRAVADTGAAFTVAPAPAVAIACARDGGHEVHDPREQLAALLAGAPVKCERLYLLGPVPWSAWFTAAPPAGWAVHGRGHYPDESTPSCRYVRGEQSLELRAASEWFGPGDFTAAQARDAWTLLGERLARVDGWHEARLYASPSITGRQLLEHLDELGEPLADEQREIVRGCMVGGRVHLARPVKAGARMPGLAYYDARVAYGALAQLAIGVGPAVHDTSDEIPLDDKGKLRARGWMLATVTPPADWSHVGIVPMREGDAVVYPTSGAFTTWADTAELALALDHGWSVKVHERLLCRTGAPLRGWARRLETLHRKLASDETLGEPGRLATYAVRAITLKTVGALAASSYRVRKPYRDPSEIPAGVQFWQDGNGAWITDERHDSNTTSYPEYAGQIWARGRVRLLDAPTGTTARAGALHVPPAELVAMRTDALYLTRDPEWPDTGEWGRFRRKGLISRPRVWPSDVRRLIVLREEAEANLVKLARR